MELDTNSHIYYIRQIETSIRSSNKNILNGLVGVRRSIEKRIHDTNTVELTKCTYEHRDGILQLYVEE